MQLPLQCRSDSPLWCESASPLQCSSFLLQGDLKLMARLLKAGADVNAGDYDKRTPLHIAAAEINLTAVGSKALPLSSAPLRFYLLWCGPPCTWKAFLRCTRSCAGHASGEAPSVFLDLRQAL